MAVNKGVWGIDIGQSALKALRLEMIDGKPTATAFDYVEHTKILSQPDADPDTLIREALEKFLSRNDVKHDEVAVGIAGQSGLARFVKLPPVEEKKIAEIVKFEAKQQIPFPLEEVVWDFQKIGGGNAVDGFALETEIGLFAMKRDVIARYLGYFQGSKTEVHFIQMTPLALVNFATYELIKTVPPNPDGTPGTPPEEDNPTPRGKKRCTVVMDVGTDASNLIITDGGKIIWQRPIPLGGNNFTRALTKDLKLTFAKAEHLKRNAAKSPDMASILKAIKPVLTDFVGEVQRSLGYFTNTHRDAHVAHLVGLGSAFKLPGLQKYLADKLALEVKKPTKFEKIGGESVLTDPLFQENLLTFPIAYGLALQGLGQARLTTNLLPKEIVQDRLIRAKKPYAAISAAALLLGLTSVAAGLAGPYASMKNPGIDEAEKAATSAESAFNGQSSKYNAEIAKSKEEIQKVKGIIAGQEERLNWARWVEVFTAAVPQPGEGGNLRETSTTPNNDIKPFNQELWWRGQNDAGKEALDWFKQRMQFGVTVDKAVTDEQSSHFKDLATVNIETVHTRYVDDVSAFLQAADTHVQEKYGQSIAVWMQDSEREQDTSKSTPRWKPKAPAEKAWVIEIRGYTDHADGQLFVQQTLLRNLQLVDKFAEKDKADQKVAKYINPTVGDPVKGKISHAFVYNVWQDIPDPRPDYFQHIKIGGGSFLDLIVDGGANKGGFPLPDGSFAPPPVPPTTPSVPPGAPTGVPPGAPGSDPSAAAPPPVAKPWRGLGIDRGKAAQITQKSGPNTGAGEGRKRSEFVVMLVWREPLPSTGGGSSAPAAPTAGTPTTGAPTTGTPTTAPLPPK